MNELTKLYIKSIVSKTKQDDKGEIISYTYVLQNKKKCIKVQITTPKYYDLIIGDLVDIHLFDGTEDH